jgi:hypothetical protein
MLFNAINYGDVVTDDCSHNTNRFRRPLITRCVYDNEYKIRIIGIGILAEEK